MKGDVSSLLSSQHGQQANSEDRMDREALLDRRKHYEEQITGYRRDIENYRSGRFTMRGNTGTGFVDVSEQLAVGLEGMIERLEDVIKMIDEKLAEG